jgi:hypothetical protein
MPEAEDPEVGMTEDKAVSVSYEASIFFAPDAFVMSKSHALACPCVFPIFFVVVGRS